MSEKTTGVGIVATTPGDTESHSGHIATRMMVAVFLHFHDEVHIFTRATAIMEFDDARVHVHRYTKPMADSPTGRRLWGQVLYQLKYCIGIFNQRNRLDLIFVSSSGTLFIVLASRLAQIFTVYRVGGALYLQQPTSTIWRMIWKELLKIVEKTTYFFAEAIVIISNTQASDLELGKARSKTYVWNHYHFDLEKFDIYTNYTQRDIVIGHVGVSEVKGTGKFLRAINELDSELMDEVLVVGGGPNLAEMQSRTVKGNHEVTFTGRIARDKMPAKFNQMKLLVVCSESEGVPKVVLEAMACGTPVLATDIGGIADYIVHEQTGFLIDDNKPETIATGIEYALSNTDLPNISENARTTIEEEFSHKSVKESYSEFLIASTPLEPNGSVMTNENQT